MTDFSNVIKLSHPIATHNLSLIRQKEVERDVFLNAFNRLATVLLLKAFESLPTRKTTVATPLAPCEAFQISTAQPIIVAPILRAGMGLATPAQTLLPEAKTYPVGMYRDETTHRPVWYYDKTPASFAPETHVFLLDPMLATGNSALAALDLFVSKGVAPENITFVCVLSAPEGINTVLAKYPRLKIITSAIDSHLNENAYIVPGLGDAGDRLFNTL